MTVPGFCPQCDRPLPDDAPQGLCPACLLKAALPGQSIATIYEDSASSPAISPEAGMRLKYFGDYELLEEIARGGMGVVWKARQTSLKRDVALKMVRAGTLATPQEVERFLREAEAAANLQHPNIVAIHEVGEYGGQHYFTMDYVAGHDLGAIVKEGPLSPHRAARYVKIVAQAIHFAHQHGTLHRDLKPQNVLVDAADQPRITDFGLAKIMTGDSRLTHSGVVMGSPSYMPPEQAAGRLGEIGPASDVYSLGAMLYELLTGRPPFQGTSALVTLHEVLESDPLAPRRLNADIPPDLETICLKCLEKTPSMRYPTAQFLAEELDRYLNGDPILARPASMVRRTASWARRHPGVLSAAAAIVVVCLTFGIFYLLEENAFLRAKQADPTNPAVSRVSGQMHDLLKSSHGISSFVTVAGMYLFLFVHTRSRGMYPFKDWFVPESIYRPLQPLGQRTRTAAVGGSLILLVHGVVLQAMTIHAYVWEAEPIGWQMLAFIYSTIYFGLATLGMAVRDYRLVHFGMADRQLTTEQIEPIRRAMENYDILAAVNLYRKVIPEAGQTEAREYVVRLADSLRTQHPGKFDPPPLSLAALNWNAMLMCALGEAVVVGALWYAFPPTSPDLAVAEFTSSLLIGMGLSAVLRVKGIWNRMLLLVPGLLALIFSETIVAPLVEASGSVWPCYWGFLLGLALMSSGFDPLKGKKFRDHSGRGQPEPVQTPES